MGYIDRMSHPSLPIINQLDVVTDRAPCGLLCSLCDSFIDGVCAGCYGQNEMVSSEERCSILDGHELAESKEVIACMQRHEVSLCNDCPEVVGCPVYAALLYSCPFKRPKYLLLKKTSYITHEKKPLIAYKAFRGMIEHGSDGFLLSRDQPDKVRSEYNLNGNFSTYWLSSIEGEGHIDPMSLGLISDTMIRFMKEREDSIILIDGIELLITNNDFQQVLRLVNHLQENMMQYGSRLLFTLDERTLEEKELALIEKSMEELVA